MFPHDDTKVRFDLGNKFFGGLKNIKFEAGYECEISAIIVGLVHQNRDSESQFTATIHLLMGYGSVLGFEKNRKASYKTWLLKRVTCSK